MGLGFGLGLGDRASEPAEGVRSPGRAVGVLRSGRDSWLVGDGSGVVELVW